MLITKVFALAASFAPIVLARDYPKAFDHKDHHKGMTHPHGYKPSHPPQNCPKQDELTDKFVCDKLNKFAGEADFIYELVKVLDCPSGGSNCWDPVRKAIYELEFQLDLFDTAIDESDLTKAWNCKQESKIACCYRRYAESLIRALDIIAEKLDTLDGETAFFIVTAVNSLRAADYTFVYELVRRMQCEQHQLEIFEKQGSIDGSTPDSIRAAFALFVSTPYITGEEFRVLAELEKPRESDIEIIEEIKCKNKPDCPHRHHDKDGHKGMNPNHNHKHHGHHHGHKHHGHHGHKHHGHHGHHGHKHHGHHDHKHHGHHGHHGHKHHGHHDHKHHGHHGHHDHKHHGHHHHHKNAHPDHKYQDHKDYTNVQVPAHP